MKNTVKIIALVSDDFEDLELWYPVYRLREEGFIVDLVGEKANHEYIGKYGVPAKSDLSFEQVDVENYDAILVPGGWAPDKLRRYEKVLEMIRYFNEHKMVIGQICHAGWVLISADILRGKTTTSTPGIKHDMINAGSNWIDVGACVDGHIVSGQRPVNLPEYGKYLVEAIKKQINRQK